MTQDSLLYGGRHRTRAVVYVRVSSDKAGGASVAEQEKACREFVAARGWDVVAFYCDNDKSAAPGSRDVRAQWQQLVQDLEAGMFDYIVVWEPSRATRDIAVWVELAEACVKQSVMFCADGKIYDPSDPDDRFHLDFNFIMAQREVGLTRKRVQRGAKGRAESGSPAAGKAPFGYRRTYRKDTLRVDTQVPDRDERTSEGSDGKVHSWTPEAILKEIFARALGGESAHSIAAWLNNWGIPNPRTLHALDHHPDRNRTYGSDWNPNVVRHTLQNNAYLGHRIFQGVKVATGRWDPLIREEDFYAIQNQFASRRTNKVRVGRQLHLLSYFARCSVCDKKVHFTNQGGVAAYRCLWGHTYVREEEADRHIELWVTSWLAVPEHLDQIRMTGRDEAEIARARAEIERLEEIQAEWEAEALADAIPLALYKSKVEKLKPQIEVARRIAFESEYPRELHALAGSSDPSLGWLDLTFEVKRTILTYLLDVKLCRVGRGAKNVPISNRIAVQLRDDLKKV